MKLRYVAVILIVGVALLTGVAAAHSTSVDGCSDKETPDLDNTTGPAWSYCYPLTSVGFTHITADWQTAEYGILDVVYAFDKFDKYGDCGVVVTFTSESRYLASGGGECRFADPQPP